MHAARFRCCNGRAVGGTVTPDAKPLLWTGIARVYILPFPALHLSDFTHDIAYSDARP